MAELQRHKAEMLDNLRMMVVWEVQWEEFQEALGSDGKVIYAANKCLSNRSGPRLPLLFRCFLLQKPLKFLRDRLRLRSAARIATYTLRKWLQVLHAFGHCFLHCPE